MEKREYEVIADNMEAEVSIYQTKEDYVPRYDIIFPEVEESTQAILDSIREDLIESVGIKARETLDSKAMEDIRTRFLKEANKLIKKEMPKLEEGKQESLAGRLVHNMLGLGKIEILVSDDSLEEIVINSAKEPIWVYHKEYGWLKTTLKLENEGEIYNYSTTIGRKVGRQITNLNPLMDAHLTTGDRVNATLFPISTQGNTITIRKFARNPWTITHFIDPEHRTLNKEIASLLWLAIQYEMNMIVAGGTASGKCLKGNEEVFTNNGKENIKELVERSFETGIPRQIDDGYVLTENPLNIKVFSLNKEKFDIVEKNIKAFWKRKSPKHLYKVKTYTGKKIEVTPEHPFFSLKNKIKKVRADELEYGDKIALPREIRLDGKGFDITNKVKKLEDIIVLSENENYIKIKTQRGDPVKLPRKTNPKLLELIGYILGDGHLSKYGHHIKFCNSSKKLLKRFKELSKSCFEKEIKLQKQKKRTDEAIIHSKAIYLILNKIFKIPVGEKAPKIKGFPELFSLSNEEIKSFLRAVFDCESYFHEERGEIEFSTSSDQFAKDVSSLLMRFGIIFRIRDKNEGKYKRVFIADLENIKKFKKKIGYHHPDKKSSLKRFLKDKNDEDYSPNFDLVPANTLISELKKKLKMSDREIAEKTSLKRRIISRYIEGSRKPRRSSLLGVSEAFERRLKKIKENKEVLKSLKKKISEIPDKNEILELCRNILYKTNVSKRKILEKSGLSNSLFWAWKTREPRLNNLLSFGKTCIDAYKDFNCNLENANKISDFLDLGITRKEVAEKMGIDLDRFYHQLRENNGKFKQKTVPYIKQIQKGKIGEMGELKSDVNRLEELLNKNVDLSEIFSKIKKIRKDLKISSIDIKENTGIGVIPYEGDSTAETTKKRVMNVLNYLEEELNQILDLELKEEIQQLKNLAKGNVFWDKVVEIEKEESKEEWVYDLTVEPNHNFIANGIVVHNTSLLNTLTPFIPPTHRIVSIEDTREIRLPDFLHWVPMTTREPNPEGKGEVSMNELMINSLRMRPDRIIVGEIRRQKQAEVLFEAMHTGHSVYSTLHANTASEVIRRMTNPPINLPENMLEALNLACVQFRDRRRGIRRTYQLAEIVQKPSRGDSKVSLDVNVMYRWKGQNDTIEKIKDSVRLMNDIQMHTGMSEREIEEDLEKKQEILQWMLDNGINTVNTVGKVMADYYKDDSKVYGLVEENKKPEQIFNEELLQELKNSE